MAFQCATQWSKFREGYVPKAGGCVPKWDAVSVLKYALVGMYFLTRIQENEMP